MLLQRYVKICTIHVARGSPCPARHFAPHGRGPCSFHLASHSAPSCADDAPRRRPSRRDLERAACCHTPESGGRRVYSPCMRGRPLASPSPSVPVRSSSAETARRALAHGRTSELESPVTQLRTWSLAPKLSVLLPCFKYALIAVLTYLTWLSRILLYSFGSTKVLYAMA